MPAMFFCVAACMGGRWLWLPLLAWFLSYAGTNLSQGYGWDFQVAIVLAGFAVVVGIGALLRAKNWLVLLFGSTGAAVLFYLVTNTGSWIMLSDYPKTWGGFIQAQTVGVPGYLPAWAFLKGLICATPLFTGLFLLGQRGWGDMPVATAGQAQREIRS